MSRVSQSTVREFLSEPYKSSFTNNDVNEIKWNFKLPKNSDKDVANAEMYASLYIKLCMQRMREYEVKCNLEREVSVLYKHCCQYKIDAYKAMCDFMVCKFSEFKEHPDRTHQYNKFAKKNGYYLESCENIKQRLDIPDFRKFILDNHKEEFEFWVDANKDILDKYFNRYRDFSHLAYNNSADDF